MAFAFTSLHDQTDAAKLIFVHRMLRQGFVPWLLGQKRNTNHLTIATASLPTMI